MNKTTSIRNSGSNSFCLFVWLVGWFLNVLVNYYVISRTGPKTERLTILRAATHETELGDHDFCLSRSHCPDTDPPVGSGRPQRESNPGPPHQESRALQTQLPPPPPPPPRSKSKIVKKSKRYIGYSTVNTILQLLETMHCEFRGN